MPKTLALRYIAPAPANVPRTNEVQVLYEGLVVLHTLVRPTGLRHLITVQGKGKTLYAAVGLKLAVVHGKAKLTITGDQPRGTRSDKAKSVLPGGSFTVDTDDYCVIEAIPTGGIYPSSNNENGILR